MKPLECFPGWCSGIPLEYFGNCYAASQGSKTQHALLDWFRFAFDRLPELWLRTSEHLMLTGVSTFVAAVIGIPLGIYAFRHQRLRGPLLGTIGVLQTIPSLAMLAILLAALHKIGSIPALVALILYAFLPIVRNTLSGLENVGSDVREAARGVGMTAGQQLWIVELPLAFPIIIAGIRTAAVIGVGVATLSAFIGAGGLGQFINRGLALSNTDLILLGAIPAALLALAVDGSIASFAWAVGSAGRRRGTRRSALQSLARLLAISSPVVLCLLGVSAYLPGIRDSGKAQGTSNRVIRIGSKNFTEQLILGELMAQIIEDLPGFEVDRKFNLGGTMICHGALANDEIDLYAEYTGTGLTAILEEEIVSDSEQVYEIVARGYQKQYGLTWLKPFGFNNTYAMAVRHDEAQEKGLNTISDLGEFPDTFRGGFTAEFMERPDGYPGLKKAYQLELKNVIDLDPAIMYQAIASGQVDVICAFATDGRIQSNNLVPLQDDLHYFPPYYAAPVIRTTTLEKFPQLRLALDKLAGQLDDATMQQLNYSVDEEQKSPHAVARAFLLKKKLLEQAN